MNQQKPDPRPVPLMGSPIGQDFFSTTGLSQIPYEGLLQVGLVFNASDRVLPDWHAMVQDDSWRTYRGDKAMRHLMLYLNGDRSEPHLAKVAWFCLVMLWYEAWLKHQEVKADMPKEQTSRPEAMDRMARELDRVLQAQSKVAK
jgi:hypothetical protein